MHAEKIVNSEESRQWAHHNGNKCFLKSRGDSGENREHESAPQFTMTAKVTYAERRAPVQSSQMPAFGFPGPLPSSDLMLNMASPLPCPLSGVCT